MAAGSGRMGWDRLTVMRTYIPITDILARDPKWAARIRARDSRKRQRLRTDPSTRAKYMRQAVKDEARRKGVKFNLSVKWFEDRLNAGLCEISGLGFDLERNGRGTPKPNTPSVDRKIAGGDYIDSNCRMILFVINHAMSNWGEEYTLNVFRHVIAKRPG